MNVKLLIKYVELCTIWNKEVTWQGVRAFKVAFK
ncbi:Uncharacterised protein [Clostridium paraputrificum]|nr:Uncharacterised protein [Clostridium paraputrificum]